MHWVMRNGGGFKGLVWDLIIFGESAFFVRAWSDDGVATPTYSGGAGDGGTVFELMPQTSGAWKERLLFSFQLSAFSAQRIDIEDAED